MPAFDLSCCFGALTELLATVPSCPIQSEYKQAAAKYRKGLKVLEDLAKDKAGENPGQLRESFEVRPSLPGPRLLPTPPTNPPRLRARNVKQLELSLHLNLAMSELKLENWAAAAKAAGKAVALETKNPKALFRRGCAFAKTGQLDEAVADLASLVAADPTNAPARKVPYLAPIPT